MTETVSARNGQLNPFLMIPQSFFTKFNPTWLETVAYIALIYYTNNQSKVCEGITWRAMAERMNVSEKTIKRGIAGLVKKGIVRVRHRSRKGEKGRVSLPNLYQLQNLDTSTGDPI